VDGAGELEKAYREEATRIRAALAARLGDVGVAEEAVQDAFVEALGHWRAKGVPPNPAAGELAGTGMPFVPGADLCHPRLKLSFLQLLARLGDRASIKYFIVRVHVSGPGAPVAPSH
jgi:hypothetical protein